MLSKNPTESQAPLSGANAGAAKDSTPPPNPRGTIEAASTGGGTVTDPGGTDRRPPNIADFDFFA